MRKTKNAVTFDSLKIGNQFEKGGNVYMKITREKGVPNAVVLSGCDEGGVVTLVGDFSVIPVTVELHVFDKE